MTVRTLRARVPRSTGELLEGLATFEHGGEALSVRASGGLSTWRLRFRDSFVRWTQRTDVRADRTGIAFEQVEGDLIDLKGEWVLTPAPAGCEVRYTVDYRTSVAHLAGAIDPVVGRVFLRAATTVLTVLAPPVELLEGERWLHDLPPELAHRQPAAIWRSVPTDGTRC